MNKLKFLALIFITLSAIAAVVIWGSPKKTECYDVLSTPSLDFDKAKEVCSKGELGIVAIELAGRSVELYNEGNYKEAKYLAEIASEYNFPLADILLAKFYSEGKATEINKKMVFKYYLKAAESGLSDAQFEVAIMYRTGDGVEKNIVEAVKWLKSSAEKNNSKAQLELAKMHLDGLGVEADIDEALKLLTQAADNKSNEQSEAQFLLGYWYIYEEKFSEGYKWAKKSAENGNSNAQALLGAIYAGGKGINKDLVYSYVWFNIAAMSEEKAYMDLRYDIEKQMTNEQIAEAQKITRECLKKELKKC
ncbi:tetratricopeptide repeat protein [Alishewanella sp. HH-ZS]|uniref:tetratricopeptide repeat protein n=1 Tax=Alishewanella sp. HH-ZS TaxID=1856684 RepID=UPI0008235BFE|nr:tetratricopeptide repeat protein [Alishewanella sp. HH-ZS]OCW93689.1 hypothetical protein A9165_15245 [Alishewanella sp. HH-ZS]